MYFYGIMSRVQSKPARVSYITLVMFCQNKSCFCDVENGRKVLDHSSFVSFTNIDDYIQVSLKVADGVILGIWDTIYTNDSCETGP